MLSLHKAITASPFAHSLRWKEETGRVEVRTTEVGTAKRTFHLMAALASALAFTSWLLAILICSELELAPHLLASASCLSFMLVCLSLAFVIRRAARRSGGVFSHIARVKRDAGSGFRTIESPTVEVDGQQMAAQSVCLFILEEGVDGRVELVARRGDTMTLVAYGHGDVEAAEHARAALASALRVSSHKAPDHANGAASAAWLLGGFLGSIAVSAFISPLFAPFAVAVNVVTISRVILTPWRGPCGHLHATAVQG